VLWVVVKPKPSVSTILPLKIVRLLLEVYFLTPPLGEVADPVTEAGKAIVF
jgi:hypothetical protein